ncbi:MAG TPA: ABC transporter permease subunit, partial [Chloroflexota bacterium]|nr:ABC transporter permease subunit [Chloroflexota bacterium]
PTTSRIGWAAPLPRRSRPRLARWQGYALALPALLLVLGVVVYPVVYDAWLSLTNASNFAGEGRFIGLANYARLLSRGDFWEAARTSAFLTLSSALLALLLGVLTALLLWWRFWGRALVFLAVFVPWAFPASFSAFAWYWMLMPPFHSFYTSQALAGRFWLEGVFGLGAWQVLSIVVTNVWRGSSIIAIFTLAGFNAIPEELLEYGKLETRNPWQYFWRVVAPLSRRYLVLGGLVALVVAYAEFVAMYIETGGRILVPVVGTIAYVEGALNGRNGFSAAVSLAQVALAAALAIVALRLVERQPAEEAEEEYGWRISEKRPAEEGPQAYAQRLSDTAARAAAPPSCRGRVPRWLLTGLGSVAALAAMVFHLFPVWYTAVQAVRPLTEFPIGNIFWAYQPDFSGLADVLSDPVLLRWTINTAVIFGSVLLIGLAAALLAGYGLARFAPPGGRWIVRLLFFSYFLPQTAVILPLYQLFNATHLDNTLGALILVYLTFAIPFSTWLFWIYFQGLDTAVEDHARLDGSRLAVFRRIVLPMAWPVIIAAGLFSIGMMGSDVIYAGTLALSNSVKTLPGGLGITDIDLGEWANVNAAMILASLPIIAICAALSRYFVRGLRAALIEGA